MTLQAPPTDGSGGYIVIGYGDSFQSHKLRVHVRELTGSVGSGPNYAWTYGGAGGGDEADTHATAEAVINLMQPLYDSTWSFWVEAIVQNNGTNYVNKYPTTAVGTEVGSLDETPMDLDNPARFCATIVTMRSNATSGLRLYLVGAGQRTLMRPQIVTSAAGGFTTPFDTHVADRAIAAYFSGTATAVQAHDGHKLIQPARFQVTQRDSLRKSYGFA